MWDVYLLSCFFLCFRFSFPFCDPSVHADSPFRFRIESFFHRPSAFPFLFLFRLSCSFRWLVQGPHQTTLPPLETLIQNLADNLRQEIPSHLVAHLGIPPSFQTGLRDLRPLDLTNHNRLPRKPMPPHAPFLITNCCTHGLPLLC